MMNVLDAPVGMVFGRKQGESPLSCRCEPEGRFSRTFHAIYMHVELACKIVGLLQPGDDLSIHVIDGVYTNAVGEERIEAGCGFEPLRCRHVLKDESEVNARRRRRLDHGKLFLTAQAHIALLWYQFNIIAKSGERRHQRIVQRLQTGLLAAVQQSYRIVTGSFPGLDQACRVRLFRLESDAVCGAVGHAVLTLQHGDDLGVFSEAALFDQSDPLAQWFAVLPLDIADLRLYTLVNGTHRSSIRAAFQ